MSMDLSTAKSHQKGCPNPAVGTSQIRFWNSPWWLQFYSLQVVQDTLAGMNRLTHQDMPHSVRQRKGQLVRLGIAQADRQAALRVSVDQQDFLSGLRQPDSQVGTGRCLANAAFLVGMAMICVFIDFTSFLIIAVASGNRKSRHFKINSEVTALSIAGIRVPEMKKAPSIYTVCYIKFIFNYSN